MGPGPSRHKPHRLIVFVSALISIGFHVAILKTQIRTPESGGALSYPLAQKPQAEDDQMRIVRVTTVVETPPGSSETAVEPAEIRLSVPVLDVPELGDTRRVETINPFGSVRDRLVPQRGDLRFWSPVVTVPKPRRQGGFMDGFAEALQALLDSIAAAEGPPEAKAWTRQDRWGRVWGASPGILHLGNVSIPLCGGDFSSMDCGFGSPPGKLKENKERRWINSVIDQSAFRQSMRRLWANRASAMNARRNKERRGKEGSGGSIPET